MSIQLELKVTSGKPIYRGHDHYWSVIRDLGKVGFFTRQEIAQRSNDPTDKCIADFLKRLELAGYIETVTQEARKAPQGGFIQQNVFRLLKRPAATPVINRDGSAGAQGLGQLNMWNAMRALANFTSMELAISATTETVSVEKVSAQRYSRHLQDAGYLQILRPGGPRVQRIWRLKPSMNTGPEAPRILRSKMVYDANRHTIMGTPTAEECAA